MDVFDVFLKSFLPIILFTAGIIGYFHSRDKHSEKDQAETDKAAALFRQKILSEVEMLKSAGVSQLDLCKTANIKILDIRGAQRDAGKDQAHMSELFKDIKGLQEATNELLRANAMAHERSDKLHEKMLDKLLSLN